MKMISGWLAVGLVIATVVALAVVGCETTESASDAIVVTVSPSTELTGSLATATLTVNATTNSALALPLVWTVSDPNLGTIRASSGLTAVYQSTGRVGNNVVTVRDQGRAEGIATIVQR